MLLGMYYLNRDRLEDYIEMVRSDDDKKEDCTGVKIDTDIFIMDFEGIFEKWIYAVEYFVSYSSEHHTPLYLVA